MVPAALGEAAIPAVISFTIFLLIDHLMDEFWGLDDITGDLHIFTAIHLAPENHPSSRDWFCKIFFKYCSARPLPTGWATCKLENNYTIEVLPQEQKSWAPRQSSQPEGLASGGGAPKNLALNVSSFLLQEFHWTKGSINSTLGSCAYWDPWKNSSDLIRVWTRPTY